MRIKKRDGSFEKLSFDRISYRLRKLAKDTTLGKLNKIDVDIIVQKVVERLYDSMPSSEIDEESARIAVSMIENEEYPKLASRIIINNLHKNTVECFSDVMESLNSNLDIHDERAPIVSDDFISWVRKYKNEINDYIDFKRDFNFDYFGFKTLEKSYLFKMKGKVVERPQHLYMRVALSLHQDDLENTLKTYDLISQGFYTHASPTMFNAGKKLNSLSSCFLISTADSIEGIFKTITDCAKISKVGGGIGVHVSNIRAKGSIIRKTNGMSDGIIPMLKVYNDVSVYVNQSGARKGSFAVYLEPWHADIMEFLDLKKNQGHEDLRARDLFYAMWISDLFMEKVEKNEPWYLMCPDTCPGLPDTYGEEFNALYESYVKEKKYVKEIPAQEIWTKILESQIETGTPYLLYKDPINRKSNQKNIGVIKSSNLCVAPDTKILTNTGHYPIKELENKNVMVWNGEKFTSTAVRKTGENQKLLSLLFNNGVEIKCTPEHIFYNKNGEKISAKDLTTNEVLIKSKFPILNENIIDDYYKKNINKESVLNVRLLLQLSGKDTRIIETPDYAYQLIDMTEDFELKLIIKRELPGVSDTYCFTESERGMGVFNGILTGQCAEITLVSNSEEIAVCNLSSIALPKYVEKNEHGKLFFNHEKLFEVARYLITPMNKVIDLNYYPTPECKVSNMRNRPLGLGVQGLHDTFILLKMPFSSPEARELNKRIFETIYYGTLTGSNDLAKKDGPYETFSGSPASQGQLQFDLWDAESNLDGSLETYNYDWAELKASIAKYGLRNSMLTTCMPTASSAQILGNCESIEPFDSCIFKRRVLSGEYIIVNKHLLRDLTELKLWNKQLKDQIILNNGSIQNIKSIPDKIKQLYKTVWEMSMKDIIKLSADRGRFIDHTQSLNLFIADPTISKLTSMHFFAWKQHLKTGMYYLRSKESSGGAKFSIDPEIEKNHNEELAKLQCSIDNQEDCMMCSS